MIVANLSRLLSGSRLVSRRPPGPEMCVVVRGTFTLVEGGRATVSDDQGKLTGDVFAPDDDAFAGAPSVPSDFADYKPRTDLLLIGDCHPPGGRPARSCTTSFSVDGWTRSLLVIGERVLQRGGVASVPKPFTSMPLTWANAFGGPGFEANPVGSGYGVQQAGARLPTVGMLTTESRPPEQTRMAASYAPISPFWAPRWSKIGRDYGAAYQEARAPFYSSDFDWCHFNAAPLEQQREQRLRGDEWIGLQNLHPEHPSLKAQLPGVRARAIVHMRDGTFGEIAMQLDTLLARPGTLEMVLTWRGHASVQEEDLSDVVSLLIACEPLEADPLAGQTYHDVLLQMERAANANTALPVPFASHGLRPPSPEPDTRPPGEQLAARLGGLIGPKFASAIERALNNATAAGSDAASRIGAQVAAIDAALAKVKPGSAPPPMSAALAEGIRSSAAALGKIDLPIAKQILADPTLASLIANLPQPAPEALQGDLRGADLRRRDLSRLNMAGFDLSGAMLAGARLHGTRLEGACLERADLTDADLTGAILTGAKLGGAVFTGAVVAGALLQQADLTGADLAGVQVSRCSFGSSVLTGANLAGAGLGQCSLAGAVLEGADLRGAVLHLCDLTAAKLDGVRAGGSSWSRCVLNKVSAVAADFADAVLKGCNGRDITAAGAGFQRCRLEACGFIDGDLTGAVFLEGEGERNNWSGATLDGADFTRTRFLRALFNGSQMKGCNFAEADLTGARFRKAKIEGGSFRHAKLLRADFNETTLTEVQFDEASMFGARFYKVLGSANTYRGADFTRAVILRR